MHKLITREYEDIANFLRTNVSRNSPFGGQSVTRRAEGREVKRRFAAGGAYEVYEEM